MLSGCALTAASCAGSSEGNAAAMTVVIGARAERDALIALLRRVTMTQVS